MKNFVENLIFGKEVFDIIGAAIEVHKELGSGFLESVYQECLMIELKKRNIPVDSYVKLEIHYKGEKINKEFVADLLAFEKIIIELKTSTKLTQVDEAQIMNYLKATKLKVGLLINFGSKEKLEWKRFVY